MKILRSASLQPGIIMVAKGQDVSLAEQAYQGPSYRESIQAPRLMLPDWLEHIPHGEFKKGILKVVPGGDAIPFPFENRLVAEYYSKT